MLNQQMTALNLVTFSQWENLITSVRKRKKIYGSVKFDWSPASPVIVEPILWNIIFNNMCVTSIGFCGVSTASWLVSNNNFEELINYLMSE